MKIIFYLFICIIFWLIYQHVFSVPALAPSGTLPATQNNHYPTTYVKRKPFKTANARKVTFQGILRWLFWGLVVLWNLALLSTSLTPFNGLLHWLSFILFWVIGEKKNHWKSKKRFQWFTIWLSSFAFILRLIFYFPSFFSLIISTAWLIIELDKPRKERLNGWFWLGISLLWLLGGLLIYYGIDLFIQIGFLPVIYYFFLGWLVFVVYMIAALLILIGLALFITGIILLIIRAGKQKNKSA
ncbi:MAG: hypothetical protein NZ108_11120 [Bacteroidia bacterium]|nr:hypothetical protein [Bacteroidia bacterium]